MCQMKTWARRRACHRAARRADPSAPLPVLLPLKPKTRYYIMGQTTREISSLEGRKAMLRGIAVATLCVAFSATAVVAGDFDGPSSGSQPNTFRGQGLNPNPKPAPKPQPQPAQQSQPQNSVSSGTVSGIPPNGTLQGPNRPNLLPGGAAAIRPRPPVGVIPGH